MGVDDQAKWDAALEWVRTHYLAHNHPPDSTMYGSPAYEANKHPDCELCQQALAEMDEDDE